MELLLSILTASWEMLLESAPLLLLGFLAAGLLYGFVPQDFIASHLGRGRFLPVVKAAVMGAPLPLCSCSVLPAAMGLRKMGATRGATMSFLVSTPENGLDSIGITYALLGPVMAILRPVAALATAVVTGVVESLAGGDDEPQPPAETGRPFSGANLMAPATTLDKLRKSLSYGFGDLLLDLMPWILGGFLAAGLISALMPPAWIEKNLGTGIAPYFIMLLLGVPTYICASASTPVAAALILKGLSPGAALVLLLSGPGTNVTSLVTLRKVMGMGSTLRYLLSVTLASLAMGFLTDLLFSSMGISPALQLSRAVEEEAGFSAYASVAALTAVTVFSAYHRWREKRGLGCCG